LARKHANDRRAVMRSPLYTRVFPNTRISPAKDTELEFATTRGGNCLATSTGGMLTGRGGNLIVIDDPTKPQDAYSETARETDKQWYGNTLLTRLDNKTEDAIVVVMQRLRRKPRKPAASLCPMNFQYPKFGSGAVQRPVAFPRRPVRIRSRR
jgi:hypothetical protein